MNIDDVELTRDLPRGSNFFPSVFARQQELMAKYKPIEERNGFRVPTSIPVDLDDRFGQSMLKDFAWRYTEELAESLEAWFDGDAHHAREEAADAMHFLAELSILAGHDPRTITPPWEKESETNQPSYFMSMAVLDLGKAMNCLKLKPWKQTHILTDRERFRGLIECAWDSFLGYCEAIGHTQPSLAAYYFKKAEVNAFRQRSGY